MSTAPGSSPGSSGVKIRSDPSGGRSTVSPAALTYSPRSGIQSASSSEVPASASAMPVRRHTRISEPGHHFAHRRGAGHAASQEPREERERNRGQDHVAGVLERLHEVLVYLGEQGHVPGGEQEHHEAAADQHRRERTPLRARSGGPATGEDDGQGSEQNEREPVPRAAERGREVAMALDEQRVARQSKATRVLEQHLHGVHDEGAQVHRGDQQALQAAPQTAAREREQHVVEQRPLRRDEQEPEDEDPRLRGDPQPGEARAEADGSHQCAEAVLGLA